MEYRLHLHVMLVIARVFASVRRSQAPTGAMRPGTRLDPAFLSLVFRPFAVHSLRRAFVRFK